MLYNDDINQIISNRGGWQTPHLKMRFFNTESFKPYMNWFSERLKEYLDHMDFNMSSGRDIFLSSMWFNINGKGAYNISHQHVETTISGVLWIKIPKNCGNFYFESPHEFVQYDFMAVQKPEMVQQMKMLYEDQFNRALTEDGSSTSTHITPQAYYPNV